MYIIPLNPAPSDTQSTPPLPIESSADRHARIQRMFADLERDITTTELQYSHLKSQPANIISQHAAQADDDTYNPKAPLINTPTQYRGLYNADHMNTGSDGELDVELPDVDEQTWKQDEHEDWSKASHEQERSDWDPPKNLRSDGRDELPHGWNRTLSDYVPRKEDELPGIAHHVALSLNAWTPLLGLLPPISPSQVKSPGLYRPVPPSQVFDPSKFRLDGIPGLGMFDADSGVGIALKESAEKRKESKGSWDEEVGRVSEDGTKYTSKRKRVVSDERVYEEAEETTTREET